MRYALPILWCASEETRAKLLGKVTDLDSVPSEEWKEWTNPETQLVIEDYFKYMRIDREMRRPRSRSRE